MTPPTKATLAKYGLTLDEWSAIVYRQNGKCGVCRQVFGRLNIDHEHVPGWKKMAPQRRKLYVRGLLCYTCNYFWARRGMTTRIALNLADYLGRYDTALIVRSLNGN